MTVSSFWISICSYSNLTTSANNYSSKPSKVTVKLITVTLMKTSGRYLGFGILVVMNNLNLLSKSIKPSPNLINVLPSYSLYYFCKIVSIEGSKFSSASYIKAGYPFDIHSLISFENNLSENFNIFNFSYLKAFLIQLLAYIWGSIIRGHLYPWVARMEFSYETLSDGNLFIVQSLSCRGSPNVVINENFSETGI